MCNEMKVLVVDADFPSLHNEEIILKKVGATLVRATSTNTKVLIYEIADADGVLVQQALISREVLNAASQCKVIVCYGTGVNSVDLKAATQCGIFVCNIPDYCIEEVATHAFSMILSLNRKLFLNDYLVRSGEWKKFTTIGLIRRLSSLKLGIVGFGAIGRALAKRAKVFGFKIIAFDPFLKESVFTETGVEQCNLTKLLKDSDFISLHVSLSEKTKDMISRNEFKIMKSSTYLINVSRGGLINEVALIDALKTGQIAGAGLDVFKDEPISKDNPLCKIPQVLLTPHLAYYSKESQTILQQRAAEEVARVLTNQPPRNAVNPEVIKPHKTPDSCLEM